MRQERRGVLQWLYGVSDDDDVCPPVSLPHIRVPASAPPVRSALSTQGADPPPPSSKSSEGR